jgi:site-specific recombinase XerD
MKTLKIYLEEYLKLRRSMGTGLERQEFELRKFIQFMKANRKTILSNELAVIWATKAGKAKGRSGARRLVCIHQFAKYVHLEDPRHEIPHKMLLAPIVKKKKLPYVYTDEEVLELMRLAARRRPTFLGPTYSTLIGLLSCTGMRVGEAIGLNLEDFCVERKTLDIKKDKRGHQRQILLHKTTVEALSSYLKLRTRLFPSSKRDPFFVSSSGQRLHYNNVSPQVQSLLKKQGIYHSTSRPAIHDLRHTFAINTIRRWHQEGHRVENKLMALSTYLGHATPNSTYWYLTATQELMASLTMRLNKKLGGLL